MKNFRVSGDPLAMICPAAAWGELDPFTVDWVNVAGDIGSAAHEIASEMFVNGYQIPDDFMPYIKKFGLSEDDRTELHVLAAYTRRFLNEFGDSYPNPRIEEVLEWAAKHYSRSGHPDNYSLVNDDSEVRILDWKTTRLSDTDYWAQMKGYAWLLLTHYPALQTFNCTVVYLRDQEVDVRKYTADEILAYDDEFVKRVICWDRKSYYAGGHCRFCPRAIHCEAQQQVVRSTAQALMKVEEALKELAPQKIVALYRHAQVVSKRIEQELKPAMRVMLEASEEGRLRGEDGYDLALVPQKPRDEIQSSKAWKAIMGHLEYLVRDEFGYDDEDLAEDAEKEIQITNRIEEILDGFVSIKKGAMLDSMAAMVEKGKGKFKEQVMADIDAAGGLKQKIMAPQMRVVKRKD